MGHKEFMCFWGAGYTDSIVTEEHGEDWFTEDMGYEDKAIEQVMGLEVCESADVSDLSGRHIVIRTA